MTEEKIELPKALEVTQEQMKKELLSIPDIVLKLRGTLYTQEERHLIIINELKYHEIKLFQKIHMDETFKNEKSRELELKRQLATDNTFIELKKKETTAHKNLEDTKNDIEFCIHRLRSLWIISRFYNANTEDY
jgi:hypothetical protein